MSTAKKIKSEMSRDYLKIASTLKSIEGVSVTDEQYSMQGGGGRYQTNIKAMLKAAGRMIDLFDQKWSWELDRYGAIWLSSHRIDIECLHRLKELKNEHTRLIKIKNVK